MILWQHQHGNCLLAYYNYFCSTCSRAQANCHVLQREPQMSHCVCALSVNEGGLQGLEMLSVVNIPSECIEHSTISDKVS